MVDKKPEAFEDIILELIGNRWKLVIINHLMDGTKRFGELQRQIGDITQKVLTTNLRALEDYGLLVREVYSQIPPKVEYTLTSMGRELKPIIDSAIEWSFEYKKKMLQQS